MLRVVNRLVTLTEDARRSRRDRLPVITVHADADRGLAFDLLARIKPRVEQALDVDLVAHLGRDPGPDLEIDADTIPIVQDGRIPIRGKPGYFFAWGGEAERSAESQAKLATSIPVYFGLMVLVVVSLFNALRQPLIVLLTVPLSMIGVTAGLLLTGQPFGFMSLLGVIGLSGMLIGNAIVLVNRIDLEIRGGKARLSAILDSGCSCLRPVGLAAGITVLALLPLLQDDLFVSMTLTIMSGLGVATLLTLVVVPVLYAVMFRVRDDEVGPS
jgi:multidrug efflux pump subunit AcrB